MSNLLVALRRCFPPLLPLKWANPGLSNPPETAASGVDSTLAGASSAIGITYAQYRTFGVYRWMRSAYTAAGKNWCCPQGLFHGHEQKGVQNAYYDIPAAHESAVRGHGMPVHYLVRIGCTRWRRGGRDRRLARLSRTGRDGCQIQLGDQFRERNRLQGERENSGDFR